MIDNISWLSIYPEIVLFIMGCVITLVDLGVKSARRTGARRHCGECAEEERRQEARLSV